MTWLGSKPDTVFLGQQVRYPGNALYKTLEGVPLSKRIEMPVAEDMQMGISIGLALTGKVPITIYPRMDFLLCAMNQLVNHLDKYPVKVIVRVCVGSKIPLDPGPQHCGDYCEALRTMLKMPVIELTDPRTIWLSYQRAYENVPMVLVEYGDMYGVA